MLNSEFGAFSPPAILPLDCVRKSLGNSLVKPTTRFGWLCESPDALQVAVSSSTSGMMDGWLSPHCISSCMTA